MLEDLDQGGRRGGPEEHRVRPADQVVRPVAALPAPRRIHVDRLVRWLPLCDQLRVGHVVLQGLVQLQERGLSYHRAGLEVAFRRLPTGVQGVLVGFGRLVQYRQLPPGADYKAAADLLGAAARTLDFWSESVNYAHMHRIFIDAVCELWRSGLRQVLVVLHGVDACYARTLVQLQQQEALRAKRVKLQAEFAEKAAQERQAALQNAAFVERMRSQVRDITARRPTAVRHQPEPQISAKTVLTIQGLREKRWRDGRQTWSDLRRVQGSTELSELLPPVMGAKVVDRLKLKGWHTVQQLLKAGENKATAVVPALLPELKERLRRVITALREHLGIKPESVWEKALERSDNEDEDSEEDVGEEDNESTSFDSDEGSPKSKRSKG